MKKAFIITIDTEGDNLWSYTNGNEVKTENAKYLSRFQKLCEKYQLIPVYLTNYEMVKSPEYIDFAKDALCRKKCEIGMHLHAWNTPPFYKLTNKIPGGLPYLIEYPKIIMEEKIKRMTAELEEAFEQPVLSHRAGRWATNDDYFELLIKYGYRVDCSVTPHINWVNAKGQTPQSSGSDYSTYSEHPYLIRSQIDNKKYLLEFPMSIRKIQAFIKPNQLTLKGYAKAVKGALKESIIWLRPTKGNLNNMIYLLRQISKEEIGYAQFMIHSSELMPGGSPYFKAADDIEILYNDLEILFQTARNNFIGRGFESLIPDFV